MRNFGLTWRIGVKIVCRISLFSEMPTLETSFVRFTGAGTQRFNKALTGGQFEEESCV